MKETELAKPVVAWLQEQHWDVYQEVQLRQYGGVADIIAVQGAQVWAIECKTSLTLGVMDQASLWRVHFRSVAVPAAKSWRSRVAAQKVARNYFKVGVLNVHTSSVNEVVAAPYMREFRRSGLKIRDLLEPEHKTFAQAGNAEGSRWTPYQRTIRDVRSFLEKNPGSTMKEIQQEIGRGHYASPASCRGNLGKALENWEDWCRVDRNTKPFRYYVWRKNETRPE